MSYSLLDILDNNCLECIASVLVSPLNAPLRAICARMRALIKKPTRMRADDLLAYGANLGDAGGIAVCKLSRKWTLDSTIPYMNYHYMFTTTAQRGRRDFCELAWQWLCEDKPPRVFWKHALATMITEAVRAKARQRELCELASTWIERANALMQFKPIRINAVYMLRNAARAGNLDMCMLACHFGFPGRLSSSDVLVALRYAQDQEVIDFLKSLIT